MFTVAENESKIFIRWTCINRISQVLIESSNLLLTIVCSVFEIRVFLNHLFKYVWEIEGNKEYIREFDADIGSIFNIFMLCSL